MSVDPKRVQALFLAAVEQTDPAARAALLARECAEDAELRRRVEALLKANEEPESYLDRPAVATVHGTVDFAPVVEGVGSKIGPYKLLQQIGEGGMGIVYMAEQQEPVRRKVALKIIKPGMDSAQVIARFEAERQALAMMDHQNIAKVFDAGTTETGRPYFVMELVHGVPLTAFCDLNRRTLRQRLELFIPVCRAIQHAHQKGIIHRDVKPSNVLVTMYDDRPVPKVIDFGIAKATDQQLTERTMFTQFGAMVGTFEYMSPEQAEMNAFGVDTRSDIYSLGVLLYELLTGTTPLEKARLRTAAYNEVVRIIKEEEPPRPSIRLSRSETAASIAAARKAEPQQLSKLIRGDLDWIVMRCLEKQRDRRYETANGLARDIERHLSDEPVEARPPSAGYRLRKFVRRHKAQATAAGLIVLALLAGIAGTTYGLIRADQQRRDAEQARAEEKQRAEGERRAKDDAEAKRADAEKQQRRAEAGEKLAADRLGQVEAAKRKADQQRRDAEQARAKEKQRAEGERRAKDDAEVKRAEAEKQQRRAEAGEKLAAHRLGQVEAEKKKAEAAADGERQAREAETITLADAHTSLGLIAAEQNKPDEAVLWFASAANLSRADPQRELANRTRFAAWARRLPYPVAVLPHPGQKVTSVVFHPGDDYLLAFTGSGGYALYDVRTGRLAELPIASQGQGCVEWSPDGKLLAHGDAQGRVNIYGFPECRLTHELKHPGAIRTLRFSDDGRYLAIGSDVVRVWSTAKNDFLAGELHHPQAVAGIDFDHAGGRLVTSCLDNMARVFAIDDQRLDPRPLFPPTEHKLTTNLFLASVFHATFVANSGLLVSKDHSELRWLDAETGAELRRLKLPRAYLTTVRVSPDRGRFVMCGKEEGACQVWDATRRDGAGITLAQPLGTLDAAFNPDGKSVVTAGVDGKVNFWPVLGGERSDAPLSHQDSVRHVAYSASGNFLATVQEGGLVRVWRLPPPVKTEHVPAPISGRFRLVLSADGRFLLASGGWFGEGIRGVQVYDAASGSAIGPLLTTSRRVNGADFSPDGSRVIAAVAGPGTGRDGIVVWDWGTGKQCFPTIAAPSEPVDVSYSPGADYAVAVCAKGEVLIIDVNTGQVRKSANHGASNVVWWQSPKRSVVFSRDGRHFATLGLGKAVCVWSAAGELTCSVQHHDAVRQAVFSPKGDYLATASHDYSAQVCEVASGKMMAALRHPGWALAVQFSPDQRQLLTACTDGMARLWDWERGCLVCPGFDHTDEVCDARFVPHQPWILTLGHDAMIRGWEPLTGKAIMPPLRLWPRLASHVDDLMIAGDGRLIAIPGTRKFLVCDLADSGILGRQQIDLARLQLLAELYAGRRIVASGTVKLTAEEWLQRWKSAVAAGE